VAHQTLPLHEEVGVVADVDLALALPSLLLLLLLLLHLALLHLQVLLYLVKKPPQLLQILYIVLDELGQVVQAFLDFVDVPQLREII